MKAIDFSTQWTTKLVELNFQTSESSNQGARYGIMALAKSSDGKFVDGMTAIYTLNFDLAGSLQIPVEISSFWGIYKAKYFLTEVAPKYMEKVEIETFEHYFRLKALQAFHKEGIIDKISYTDDPGKNIDS